MTLQITAATRIAGVVGAPVRHSLSPLMHNAWIRAAGVDAVYLAFAIDAQHFEAFLDGLRGGAVLGLNVTLPFKERALAAADRADDLAVSCGSANLLLLHADGSIEARNTDGEGLIGALRVQAPNLDLKSGPVVVLGAGGAARGAVAALIAAGTPEVRVVNRTLARARALARHVGAGVRAIEDHRLEGALDGAIAVINATSVGLDGGPGPELPWRKVGPEAVAMDMIYRPLATGFLKDAAARGLRTVDGLEMLIRQAAPSFEALFGRPSPDDVDARSLLLAALEGVG